jgi:2,5-diketo-D-gluconate reductase A
MMVALAVVALAAVHASTAVAATTTAAAIVAHRVRIAPGVTMPIVNLGGVDERPSNWTAFLRLGGRGIDTALTYGDATQREVAAAIASSDVPRSEIFLTTKVPCCPKGHGVECGVGRPETNGSVARDVAQDLAILGKVDMLLLHWPCDTPAQTLRAYRGLEAALAKGHTRASASRRSTPRCSSSCSLR